MVVERRLYRIDNLEYMRAKRPRVESSSFHRGEHLVQLLDCVRQEQRFTWRAIAMACEAEATTAETAVTLISQTSRNVVLNLSFTLLVMPVGIRGLVPPDCNATRCPALKA